MIKSWLKACLVLLMIMGIIVSIKESVNFLIAFVFDIVTFHWSTSIYIFIILSILLSISIYIGDDYYGEKSTKRTKV